MAAKAKELIKAATISRVSDKTGRFLGFGVKSNHSDEYYQIHCTKSGSDVIYTCNCEARQWGKECCHVKAVRELVEARKVLQLDAAAVVAPLVLGSFAQDLDAHIDDEFAAQMETGELEQQAYAILAAERDAQVQAEVASLPSIDSDPMDELDRVQAEKRRKMAANQAYRDMFPGDYGYCDAA